MTFLWYFMIFVFDKESKVSFWMKNTHIPLSAAFVAPDGTVVKIARMKPLSTDHHRTDVPVKYVLEANEGWFKKAGVRIGDRLDIEGQLRAKTRPGA